MVNWEEYRQKSKKRKSLSSDEALIRTFNREVGCAGWGTARMWHLHYLSHEIRRRNFNSDIIFDLDEKGNILAMKPSKKVKLVDDKLVFVD